MTQQGNGDITDGDFNFSYPHVLWLEFSVSSYFPAQAFWLPLPLVISRKTSAEVMTWDAHCFQNPLKALPFKAS